MSPFLLRRVMFCEKSIVLMTAVFIISKSSEVSSSALASSRNNFLYIKAASYAMFWSALLFMPSIRVLSRFAGFEVLSASSDSSALFLVAFS
jgi:hypothetical protein